MVINLFPILVMVVVGLIAGLATGSVQSGLLGFAIAMGLILIYNLIHNARQG